MSETELPQEPQSIEAEWPSGGITIRIKTPRETGETTAAWLQRHKDAVDAAKVIWEPD